MNDRPDLPSGAPRPDVPLMQNRSGREPAFNLPASLVWLLGGLVLIHAVRTYLVSLDVDAEILFNFAFLPVRYLYPLDEQSAAWLWSPVTYSLLHGSWEHVIFNGFWMVAFGAPVVRRIGVLRFFAFWCVTAAGAVAIHSVFHWGELVPVVGASGAVAGLMGAAARFVFSPGGRIRRQDVHLNPRLGIVQTLKNRSALAFAGIWFATNILIGLGGLAFGGGTIAWEAHIGGFLFGFFLFPLFDPLPRPTPDATNEGPL